MIGGRQVFLFVVWAKARPFEAEIRETLERDFKILLETEMSWPRWDFTRKLREFYGFGSRFAWWNEARKCGRGPFKVFLVEDDRPEFKPETDTRGQRQLVDARVYRDKQTLRRLTRHSNIVHSSTTAEETDAQMKVLFGCGTEELMSLLSCDLKFLAAGSRRACYEIHGTNLCLKCYRDEAEIANATVAREIRRCRHDERRNTCCQEYRYYQELKRRLPGYVFAAFPERLEQVYLPARGWCLVESRVRNADGSPCERFSRTYRDADKAMQAKLLKEFWLLIGAFAAYGVRFYDPQNILVQHLADGSFRLRVVDFEPAARTLIPIDTIFPFLIRGKVIRRATRYLKLHGRVEARYKGLPSRLRRKWDNLIATEGAKMGLSDCVPFLENKLLNDIFYRGTFNGKPCVVKCSSRSPDSIRNERDMLLRLHGADLLVAVAPLGYWCSSDRHFAFIITDELPGPELSAVLKSDLSDEDRKRIASNLLRIVDALVSAGIVWRDLIPGNLLRDLSGHYRLIDAQLAVHREAPKECKFMQTNREYRLLLFAYNEALHGKGWCDADFIRLILQRLNKNDLLVDEMRRLEEAKPKLTINKQITALDRLYVLLLKFEFAVQVYLRKGANVDSVRERLRRVNDILGGEA